MIVWICSEVFTGPEKRRKRGSLFSRKKKDKMKTKGQSVNCDGNIEEWVISGFFSRLPVHVSVCGAAILTSYKEHAVECKIKLAKVKHNAMTSGTNRLTSSLLFNFSASLFSLKAQNHQAERRTQRAGKIKFCSASFLFHATLKRKEKMLREILSTSSYSFTHCAIYRSNYLIFFHYLKNSSKSIFFIFKYL